MARRHPDDKFNFQKKKSVHVNLRKETHSEFRINLFKMHLSMQEAFEEFAQQVSIGHPLAIKILEELVERKKAGEIAKLSDTEADEIYKMIEEEGPLGGSSWR